MGYTTVTPAVPGRSPGMSVNISSLMQSSVSSENDISDANTSFYSCHDDQPIANVSQEPLWLVVARQADQTLKLPLITPPTSTPHDKGALPILPSPLDNPKASSASRRRLSSLSSSHKRLFRTTGSLSSQRSFPLSRDRNNAMKTYSSPDQNPLSPLHNTKHTNRSRRLHKTNLPSSLSILEQALEKCRKSETSPHPHSEPPLHEIYSAVIPRPPKDQHKKKKKKRDKPTPTERKAHKKDSTLRVTHRNTTKPTLPRLFKSSHSPKKVDQPNHSLALNLIQPNLSMAPLSDLSLKRSPRSTTKNVVCSQNTKKSLDTDHPSIHPSLRKKKKTKKKKKIKPSQQSTSLTCPTASRTPTAVVDVSQKIPSPKKNPQPPNTHKKKSFSPRTKLKLPTRGNTRSWRMSQYIQTMTVETLKPDFLAAHTFNPPKDTSQDNKTDINSRTPQYLLSPSRAEDDTVAKTLSTRTKYSASQTTARSTQQGWFMTPRQTEMLRQLHTGLTPHSQTKVSKDSTQVTRKKRPSRKRDPLSIFSEPSSENSFIDSMFHVDPPVDILQTLEPTRSLQTHRLIERHRKKLQALTKKLKRPRGQKETHTQPTSEQLVEKPSTPPPCHARNATLELQNALEANELRNRRATKKESLSALQWIIKHSRCEIERKQANEELCDWDDSETLDHENTILNSSDADRTPQPTLYESS